MHGSDKILLVCNRMSWCDHARSFIEECFANVTTLIWDHGEPYPSRIDGWTGDWTLSFRGDLIFSDQHLARAGKGALNFHPAPPKYRGMGSHQYAIYHGDREFGTTCHRINSKIDDGQIIKVLRFPIAPSEGANSLGHRVGAYCLILFYEIVTEYVLTGRPLPTSPERWGEKLSTRRSWKEWQQVMRLGDPGHRCIN